VGWREGEVRMAMVSEGVQLGHCKIADYKVSKCPVIVLLTWRIGSLSRKHIRLKNSTALKRSELCPMTVRVRVSSQYWSLTIILNNRHK
jgi:hypothetical protein